MPMLSRLVLSMAVLALVGCSKGFDRGQMDAALRLTTPKFVTATLSVEEIDRLRPQARLPFRLAVAPPIVASERWRRDEQSSNWSPEEVAEIESWEEPLKKAGVVDDLLIVPAPLVQQHCADNTECALASNRTAAARLQADALLMISLACQTDEYPNPASALDLTIVGLWVVPAHHHDALTIAEGVLIDNRNEYLYAFARGEGEAKLVRPFAYDGTEAAARSSRLRALQAFGAAFVQHASNLRAQ